MDVEKLINEFGDVIFEEITKLWNWVFERGHEASEPEEKYKPVTRKWVEDNVSVGLLVDIAKEIAEQSRIGWLLPLFKSRFLSVLGSIQITEEPGEG